MTGTSDPASPGWHGTTILAVRKNNKLVMLSDGQVSMGQTVMKGNARKVRRLGDGKILAGFGIMASSPAPPWNSPRTGAQRNTSRNLKPC